MRSIVGWDGFDVYFDRGSCNERDTVLLVVGNVEHIDSESSIYTQK